MYSLKIEFNLCYKGRRLQNMIDTMCIYASCVLLVQSYKSFALLHSLVNMKLRRTQRCIV